MRLLAIGEFFFDSSIFGAVVKKETIVKEKGRWGPVVRKKPVRRVLRRDGEKTKNLSRLLNRLGGRVYSTDTYLRRATFYVGSRQKNYFAGPRLPR